MNSLSLQAGQMVGPYRIVKKAGSGGMGEVYEAWDDHLKRAVAIKILSSIHNKNKEIQERFLAEGRSLARVRHRNVVSLYLVGEHEGLPFMAMEFIDGQSLDEYMSAKPCGLKEILSIFRQVLEGLAAAHAEGIIHRDIKPSNIMVDKNGVAQLVDFGIAKSYGDDQRPKTDQGIVLGTKSFLAPELLAGKSSSPQSDIYSLGLVLQFMITAELPRIEANAQQKRAFELLPLALKDLLVGMTQKTPELRYKNTSEVLKDLSRVNLDDLHSDLIVENAKELKIENLDQVYAHCKKHGLHVAEARLVANLATRLDHKVNPRTDHRVTLDEKVLDQAVVRIKAAKTQVAAKRVAHGAAPAVHSRSRRSFSVPIGKLFFLISLCSSGYFYMTLDKGKAIAYIEQRVIQIALGVARKNVPEIAEENIETQAIEPPQPAKPASATPIATLAPAPALKVGQTFKYRYLIQDTSANGSTKDRTMDWEVVSVRAGKVHWEDGDGAREHTLVNPFFPPLSSDGTLVRQPEKNEIHGDVAGLFPLTDGKWVVVKVNPISRKGEPAYDLTCIVGPLHMTSTPAGNFNTIRIDCASEFQGGTHASYYYAPQLNHWVAADISANPKGRAIQTKVQLVGYSFPAAEPVRQRKPAATCGKNCL